MCVPHAATPGARESEPARFWTLARLLRAAAASATGPSFLRYTGSHLRDVELPLTGLFSPKRSLRCTQAILPKCGCSLDAVTTSSIVFSAVALLFEPRRDVVRNSLEPMYRVQQQQREAQGARGSSASPVTPRTLLSCVASSNNPYASTSTPFSLLFASFVV